MRLTYLFRSPGTGHSIEELFDSIRQIVGQLLDSQVRTVTLPYISRGGWSVWRNSRFLRGLDADVFHITGDVHYVALMLPASRTVLTIHDCILLRRNQKRPLRYLLFWLFWYYLPIRRAHTVTTVSEKTRQELIHRVGEVARKVVVVPNGHDPRFTYRPVSFRKTNPVLLQVGTASHKNLYRLLEAIDGIACTLILIGPLSARLLNELTKRRIKYRHYQALSRRQVIRLYEAYDIVTFVSTYEGFGMPIIEANAIGRAVLTSAIEPMATLAGGAAIVVNPFDAAAIRDGIKRLIQDDAYRQKLIIAGQKNAQQYIAANCAEQYLSLYRKLVNP